MISSIISRLVILVFGTLYPAYASYKAVRTKNLKEYVKWMMYWIVFALFTCTETFTDVFLSWFPFYYEVKIVIVLWLLSPATKGSSILYRKFVHPALCRREQEIDEYIAKAKDQGYHTVLNLGTKGVNYATTVIMQTAIKGGGGLVQQIRKSYSLSDLTECDPRDERTRDEADDVLEPQIIRRTDNRAGYNTRRSASESGRSMYFSEVDVDVRSNRSSRSDEPDFSHIKSSEDISSGYSSAGDSGVSLARAGSIGARRAKAGRTTITSIKRPQAAEDSEVIIEELHDDDSYDYANMPALLNMPSPLFLSHTDPPFIYQYVGDQVKIVQVLGFPLEKQLIAKEQALTPKDNTQNEFLQKEEEPKVDTLETIVDNGKDNIPDDKDSTKDTNVNSNHAKESLIQDASTVSLNENFMKPNTILNFDKINDGKLTDDQTNKEVLNSDDNTTSDKAPQNESTVREERNSSVELTVTKEDVADTTSLDTSVNDNASAESDDEASFGTPDNSPKPKRKLAKGKYGKGKAPAPPTLQAGPSECTEKNDNLKSLTTSQESLADLMRTLPPNSITKDPSPTKNLVVNPIAEIKQRHKAKSPGRISRGNSSAIGKLLQIPSKIAFWNKSDKSKSDTSKSVSSEDDSRRSSMIEKATDDFQSCLDVSDVSSTDAVVIDVREKSEDRLSFKEASEFESEVTTHDIMEKSVALQKLIEAKIESHPEYKVVPNEEISQCKSKTTDV